MKDEPASPPVHSLYTSISGPNSHPHHIGRQAIEELPPAIRKVCGPILHYIGGDSVDGPSGSRTIASEEDKAAHQRARYDRCNAARHSLFAKTSVASECGCNNPDLAAAWSLDRSITTNDTGARHRRLDSEITKYGESGLLARLSM